MSIGTHIILDCYDVPRSTCLDDKYLLKAAVEAATAAGANIINTMRYRFGHDSPPGCCIIVMLDESHISIHTYADKEIIAIDVFTCGETCADRAILSLKGALSLRNCVERKFGRFLTEGYEMKSHSDIGVCSARNSTQSG